jgi:hypothetical protein
MRSEVLPFCNTIIKIFYVLNFFVLLYILIILIKMTANDGVDILDSYYVAFSAIFSLAFQLAFFFVAAGLKFDKVTGIY